MTERDRQPRTPRYPETLTSLGQSDLSRVTEILSAAFGSITQDAVQEYIPLAIAADSADVIVSRGEQGQIASVMVVNIGYGAGKIRGYIDDVATHKDSLRQGHAGAVLDFALDWFRERGASRVILTSRHGEAREAAHRLYESRGFEIYDTNVFRLKP